MSITFAEVQPQDDTELRLIRKGDRLYRRDGRRFVQIEITTGGATYRDEHQAELFEEQK